MCPGACLTVVLVQLLTLRGLGILRRQATTLLEDRSTTMTLYVRLRLGFGGYLKFVHVQVCVPVYLRVHCFGVFSCTSILSLCCT
jgi:hypothetical protein